MLTGLFSGGGLKETGTPHTEGEYRCSSHGQYDKNKVFFFNIKACKHVLVQTQNTSIILKMLYNSCPLILKKDVAIKLTVL